ncbi:DUF2520 domain-containing protein [Flavobacteriaceae bacterium F08102]|nr:DUF2520 domain-containing protein [Flavobacteriaceae bacterium F08102]
MISVILLGTGNVSTHLLNAFNSADNVRITQVYGRNESALKRIAKDIPYTRNLEDLKKADVYILAISDDQISTVANHIQANSGLVVHTSGTQPITALKNHIRRGIFYPLQTFSSGAKIDFSKIPICIEATSEKDYELLEKLAKTISKNAYRLDSEKRKKLHLAAVFVNNFSNHLYHLGEEICLANDLPFEILYPLIEETALKIQTTRPIDAQTGPARRNDQHTINQQLKQLTGVPLELYSLFTASIKKNYE